MSSGNPLERYTAPVTAGAALRAERNGGLVLVSALTPGAGAWLREAVADDAQWIGQAVVIELRYFPAFADGAIAAGLLFERDAYPY